MAAVHPLSCNAATYCLYFPQKQETAAKKSETDVVWVDRNNCWGWLYIFDPFSGNLWSHRRLNWFHFLFLHAVPYSQDFNHIFPEWPNPRDKCQDMTSRCVQPSGHVSSFGLFNFYDWDNFVKPVSARLSGWWEMIKEVKDGRVWSFTTTSSTTAPPAPPTSSCHVPPSAVIFHQLFDSVCVLRTQTRLISVQPGL